MNTSMTVDLEQRVLAGIDPQYLVEFTSELIAAGGENPGQTEERTVRVLVRALSALGATVTTEQVAPGRENVIAHLGGDGTGGGLLFLGHSDVVPAGAGWDADPFTARIDGDRLIGRGATDMKGGLAAVIAAMSAVHAHAPHIPLSLACTVDEEADAIGIQHYVASQARQAGYTACVVAEPTDLVAIVGCRGAANLEIRVEGASAHAGRPTDGASAIQAAAELVSLLNRDSRQLVEHAHPVLGAATWNVGTIQGGHGTSIVPDVAELGIDRRLLPGEDPQQLLEQLLEQARRATVEAGIPGAERISFTGHVQMYMPGFLTDPEAQLTLTAREAVRTAGGQGEYGIWTASCEGGFIAEHHRVPTLVLGPGEINTQAHQPNESVSIQDLGTAARAYALIALREYASQGH